MRPLKNKAITCLSQYHCRSPSLKRRLLPDSERAPRGNDASSGQKMEGADPGYSGEKAGERAREGRRKGKTETFPTLRARLSRRSGRKRRPRGDGGDGARDQAARIRGKARPGRTALLTGRVFRRIQERREESEPRESNRRAKPVLR